MKINKNIITIEQLNVWLRILFLLLFLTIFYQVGVAQNCITGAPCNDDDPETTYDAYNENCECVGDPRFKDQWYLHNTDNEEIDINVIEAWEITKGKGVEIAIFDTGVATNHPDLETNIAKYDDGKVKSYNAVLDKWPAFLKGSHGIKCAGIAAATGNNQEGIIGVAPEACIVPISNSIIGTDDSFDIESLARGFMWAANNDVDIISCSWGEDRESAELDDAINYALKYGRKGLGSIVIFASGNSNRPTGESPSNRNEDILCVGAIDRCGYRSGRENIVGEASCDPWPQVAAETASSYGEWLDVVAGGTTITTTSTGVETVYVDNFFGTSAACPQVAGVAALVLSVNPNLTARQVNDIIKISAKEIQGNGYNYEDKPINQNVSQPWNNEVGYGLVDAYEAVKLAQSPEYQYVCETDIPITPNNDNNNTISNSLEVRYSSTESIQTQVDRSHDNPDVIIKADEKVFMLSDHILLNEGFKVESGGCLDALIESCEN